MSLNPKYRRYADRLRELVQEGVVVAKLEKPSSVGSYIQNQDKVALHAWLTKVENSFHLLFGANSPQVARLAELRGGSVDHAYQMYPIVGLVAGALDDLEKGFLAGHEFLLAAEVFDSVLEQAATLLRASYKDPAAVLGRTVLENALRRLAEANGLDPDKKASSLNDDLKAAGRYPQPMWRLIQAWLDVGNAAAHGKFADYGEREVSDMLSGVERFLASEFRP